MRLAVPYFDAAARFQKFTDQLVAKTRLTLYVTNSGHQSIMCVFDGFSLGSGFLYQWAALDHEAPASERWQ